jgi:alkaline phosphatase D
LRIYLNFIKAQKISVALSPRRSLLRAHYYDPAKAQFTEFTPFWEFVTGPIHAGGFGPNKLDNTFGPQVVFQKAPGGRNNVPPTEGGQFYGLARVDGKTGTLKVQIKDLNGAVLFERSLS